MTKTGLPRLRHTGRARNSSAPAHEQLSLDVVPVAEIDQESDSVHLTTSADEKPVHRVFVPSNRERLLRQLSALVLAPNFPPLAGIPVDASHHAILVGDGLRQKEIDILADGRPQRFPVLAELRGAAASNAAGIYGIGDVLALHFRAEDEASNFRFRPVDEFDTDFIPCLVGPSLFGLDGGARFSDHAPGTSALEARKAATADRIAGAVCCLLELAEIEPECRDDVAGLLSRRSGAPWMKAVAQGADAEYGSGGAVAAIVRAFIEHDGDSPSHLVQALGQHLAELSDPEVARAVPRWLEMADAILANRMVLDGEILSDNRSIALRAAILGVVVDDVKNLVAFLHAERPAGMQVVVAAAFLVGLKTGVADLPWKAKLPHLELLSPLLVALLDVDATVLKPALDAFAIEPDESTSPLELALYWRDRQVLRWIAPPSADNAPMPPDDASSSIDEAASAAEESLLGRNQWERDGTVDGPDGRIIDVMAPSTVGGMTTLRHLLNETDRLRKPKEIMEAACTAAVGWRVGVNGEGVAALYLDIPGIPSDTLMGAMRLTLAEALSLYLVPPRAKTRARPKKVSKPDASSAAS